MEKSNRKPAAQLFCGCLELEKVPAQVPPALAAALCGDLYHLTGGRSNALLELRRSPAGGGHIRHLLLYYLWEPDAERGRQMIAALCRGAASLLQANGFCVSPRPAREAARPGSPEAVWALTRAERRETALASPTVYHAPEIVAGCDLTALYQLLCQESGAAVSLLLTPWTADNACRRSARQLHSDYARLRDGVEAGPRSTLRDPTAAAAAERWAWRAARIDGPQFLGRFLVWGSQAGAALAVARLQQIFSGPQGETLAGLTVQSLPRYPEPAPLTPPGDTLDGCFTQEEAAALLALPAGEQCGLALNAFSLLPDPGPLAGALTEPGPARWFLGGTPRQGRKIYLPMALLRYHGLIVGRSGFGKSTAIQNLLAAAAAAKMPALVIAPIKHEFRNLAGLDPDTLIFTATGHASPLVLNPFLPPDGVTAGQYRSTLTQIFAAAFSMPDPLPALFDRAISEAYALFGWQEDTCPGDAGARSFGLHEFIQVFSRIISRSSYSSEVKGTVAAGGLARLRKLIDRCRQFDTVRSIPAGELLARNVVLELDGLEGEDKCLTATLLLLSLLAYVKADRPAASALQNLIVLDEAHALLNVAPETPDGSGSSAAMVRQLMTRLLLEARSSGLGLVLADQSPELLGSSIVSNTDWKLIYRLEGESAAFMAQALGLDETACRAMGRLEVGQTLFRCHVQPGLVALTAPPRPRGMEEGSEMDETRLARYMADYRASHAALYRPWPECGGCRWPVCREHVRADAGALAARMLWDCPGPIRKETDLERYLARLPASLKKQGRADPGFCYCTAVQFLRKAALENRLFCCDSRALAMLSRLELEPDPKPALHADDGTGGAPNG